jgi:hypothetical protein
MFDARIVQITPEIADWEKRGYGYLPPRAHESDGVPGGTPS